MRQALFPQQEEASTATTTQAAEEAAPALEAASASVALLVVTKNEMDDALKSGLSAVAALANRPGFVGAFMENPGLAVSFLNGLSSAKSRDIDNMLIVFSALSQSPASRPLLSVVNDGCLGILSSAVFTDTFRQGKVLLKSQNEIDQVQEKRGLCLSALIKCGFSVDVRDSGQINIFVGLLRGIESRPALIQLQQLKLQAKAEGKAPAVDSLAVEAAQVDAVAAQSAKHYILVKQELASLIGKKLPKNVPAIMQKLHALCDNSSVNPTILHRAIDELTQKLGQLAVSGQKLFTPDDAANLKKMLR